MSSPSIVFKSIFTIGSEAIELMTLGYALMGGIFAYLQYVKAKEEPLPLAHPGNCFAYTVRVSWLLYISLISIFVMALAAETYIVYNHAMYSNAVGLNDADSLIGYIVILSLSFTALMICVFIERLGKEMRQSTSDKHIRENLNGAATFHRGRLNKASGLVHAIDNDCIDDKKTSKIQCSYDEALRKGHTFCKRCFPEYHQR